MESKIVLSRVPLRKGLGLILLVVGWGLINTAEGLELRLSNDFSLTHNNVTGKGSDQSALTEGTRFLNTLSLYGQGEVADFRYNFNLGLKATSDERLDPERYSLTNLQGRISNQVHTLTLGDTFEAFSRYSLNTAVKGASYSYTNPDNRLPDLTLLGGIAYPRWDNFWDTEAIERQVMGIRAKQHLTSDLWLAANLVQSEDHGRIGGSSLYDTSTFSLDGEYLPIPGLTIRGESAWSDTEESPAGGGSVIKDNGYAYRIEAIGDGPPSRVSMEYARISPDYFTVLGSATPDREKFKSRWRYRRSKTQTWNFGLLWYRNNLDGQLTDRTDHYRPEIGLTQRRLFDRRYSVLNLNYKFDHAEGSRKTRDHFITTGYRDRFGIFDNDTTLGVTFYDTDGQREDNEFFCNNTLSLRKTVGDWTLKPSVRAGVWTLENELDDLRNKTWEYSFGMGMDAPRYKINSSIRAGYKKLDKDAGLDSEKTFANMSVYYRPGFLSRLNQGMVYLRWRINDFDYSDSSRSFRENSITVGLRFQM